MDAEVIICIYLANRFNALIFKRNSVIHMHGKDLFDHFDVRLLPL